MYILELLNFEEMIFVNIDMVGLKLLQASWYSEAL